MRLSPAVVSRRRIGWICAVGGALTLSSGAVAWGGHGSPQATTAGAGGTVYGGVTSQRFPVVIETSKNGKRVEARVAVRLTCTSGGTLTVPDGYGPLSVKGGKFKASFGPATMRNDDGTTTDLEGSVSGAFNKARTKASGKWSLKGTDHDGTGAITETCDSGNVSWTAKQ